MKKGDTADYPLYIELFRHLFHNQYITYSNIVTCTKYPQSILYSVQMY